MSCLQNSIEFQLKAVLHLQGEASHGTSSKGRSVVPEGKPALSKDSSALSKGHHELAGPSSAADIQPPVMLSHLAYSKAAGLRESLKKNMGARQELEQPHAPAAVSAVSCLLLHSIIDTMNISAVCAACHELPCDSLDSMLSLAFV